MERHANSCAACAEKNEKKGKEAEKEAQPAAQGAVKSALQGAAVAGPRTLEWLAAQPLPQLAASRGRSLAPTSALRVARIWFARPAPGSVPAGPLEAVVFPAEALHLGCAAGCTNNFM